METVKNLKETDLVLNEHAFFEQLMRRTLLVFMAPKLDLNIFICFCMCECRRGNGWGRGARSSGELGE